MIRMIARQAWNQRKQNGWIFVELLVAGFFLWKVIDPIYVLTANRCIDRGYDDRNLYVVQMRSYDATNGHFNAAQASDSLSKEYYLRILRTLRELPEVESYCITTSWSFPNCDSWSGGQFFPDTASLRKEDGYKHAQLYEFVMAEGSDPFRTLGMRSALTGDVQTIPADVRGKAFLSKRLAGQLWGTTDVVGRKVYDGIGTEFEVAGVLGDFKHIDFQQPYPLFVRTNREIIGSSYMPWNYVPILRLKENVDADAFKRRFRDEVMPQLAVGNFYCVQLQSFTELGSLYAARSGVTNKLRLQYSLTGFTILCIFLGMVGTFWIRANARRQEIGVMRSMGASRRTICCQFLTEAWLLVTLAFLIILPLLGHLAQMNGMYVLEVGTDDFIPDPAYIQNRFVPHFCIVSLLSYLLLLAVSLVGTYIPVRRASRTLPAEALRDE